jgi:hypothetical protein
VRFDDARKIINHVHNKGVIMSSHLFDLYGRVTIHTDEWLWTEKDENPNLRFPLFCYMDTRCFHQTFGAHLYKLQITRSIHLIMPFQIVQYFYGRTENLFATIHENEFGKPWTYVSNVEMRSKAKSRQAFMSYLQSQGIDGWLCPKEKSIYDMEVCIFEPSKCVEAKGQWEGDTDQTNIQDIKLGSMNDIDLGHFSTMRERNSSNALSIDCDWTPLDALLSRIKQRR